MSHEVMISHKRKTCHRNRSWVGSLFLAILTFLLFSHSPSSIAQLALKTVEGRVVGPNGQPQPGAIVYLKNDKTNDIKSFISTADGAYRFGQLSSEVDYEVWASYQGKKSPVKTVSSFDSKKLLSYELKVLPGK